MKALFCTECGAQLTPALALLSGKDPSVQRPELTDRAPPTPRGTAFKSYEPLRRSYGSEPDPLEFTPQYWLNPEDVADGVRLIGKKCRLNGCCGLDGLGGPNQVCRCGSEVGTLMTDCWTPFMFVPDPTATEWRTAEVPRELP